MSENINFIPAANLPTTEAEEVDVLCVEGGELKRKPGASLGGVGGYMMKPTAEECTLEDSVLAITTNYDELAKVLEAGGAAYVRIPSVVLFGEEGIATVMPYAVAGIHSWAYLPAGTMGEGHTTATLMGCVHLNIVGSSAAIAYTVMFTNGTYIPNWSDEA